MWYDNHIASRLQTSTIPSFSLDLSKNQNTYLHTLFYNRFIDYEKTLYSSFFFGDLFDVAWKSNVRNVAIITQHLEKEIKLAQDADVIEHTPSV